MSGLNGYRKGDTLIEVLIALTAYSVVAIFTIVTMNMGIRQGETSLEISMARNEIAAQAEAIRFIHNAFLSEREYNIHSGSDSYINLWRSITNRAVDSGTSIPRLSVNSCNVPYNNGTIRSKAFVINTRFISPASPASTVIGFDSRFAQATLYPRVLYYSSGSSNSDADYVDEGSFTTFGRAEGIWVIARSSAASSSMLGSVPEYYDFHIYTCWYAPGADQPSTIGTIIRLYNPALRETIR